MAYIKNNIFKIFKNGFLLISIIFIVWMLFFDTNSWLIHHELNSEIKNLENEKAYYHKEIIKDDKAIKELKTNDGLEKFAREVYFMKRKNETIYIIDYEDSLKTKKDDQ